jgi:hypothetical protein
LGAATAQADYTVTTCTGGTPAPAWVQGLGSSAGFASTSDGCPSGGASVFSIAGTSMAANTDEGVGLSVPSGVLLTEVDYHYSTLASTGANIRVEHDGTVMTDVPTEMAAGGADAKSTLAGATDLIFNVSCANGASPCSFASPGILSVGPMTFTLHDTGQPAVSATGNLAAPGTYSGVQTLSYGASDAGSGVDKVTVALGATVLATAQSACQPSLLAPCPATAAGVLDVDTTQVPDGTYPVTVTAYDVSGDATPVQVATIVVANHHVTQSLPTPTKPGRVHTKVEMTWRWGLTGTVLKKLVMLKFGRSATITVRCSGLRCPFKVKRGDGRHVKRFIKVMEHRVFHPGQKLTFTIAQPHLRSERALVTIRRNRKPAKAL